MFQVSFDRFMEEVIEEGITENSRNKIECEDLGESLAYYLVPLGINKVYVTVLKKDEITPMHEQRLKGIIVVSKRITQEGALRSISEQLASIEEALKRTPTVGGIEMQNG